MSKDQNDLLAQFESYKPINKGLSGDKKYCIETADGRRMLLRISDISEHDRKKADYHMMAHAYAHGVATPQPFGFDVCNGGKSCYSLSSWLDGEDLDKTLPLMSEAKQYAFGLKAGEMLKKIHAIATDANAEPWIIRFERKVQYWLAKYQSAPQLHSGTGDVLVRYLDNHRNVLATRPQTFIHGDYNIENILVMADGEVSAIDFNSYNTPYGDPWWDLINIAMFPHFFTGQLNGYFNGEPPTGFWGVLKYYMAYTALSALTDPYELNGIEDDTETVNNILKWTNNLQNIVPTWYLKDFYIQEIHMQKIHM